MVLAATSGASPDPGAIGKPSCARRTGAQVVRVSKTNLQKERRAMGFICLKGRPLHQSKLRGSEYTRPQFCWERSKRNAPRHCAEGVGKQYGPCREQRRHLSRFFVPLP